MKTTVFYDAACRQCDGAPGAATTYEYDRDGRLIKMVTHVDMIEIDVGAPAVKCATAAEGAGTQASCPDCGGTGRYTGLQQIETCGRCDGLGVIR